MKMNKDRNQMDKVLIIIPAYNEEENIINVINNIRTRKLKYEYDFIVINDCSRDNTELLLRQNNYNYLSFPINLGIGGAVQAGYKYALKNNYNIAVQLDGDGQHDPCFLDELITPIVNGDADIVIGSRYIKKEGFQSSIGRRAGIAFLSKLIDLICGKRIYDVTSGFRAVNRSFIRIFSQDYPDDYPEPEAIVMAFNRNARITELPVIMHERNGGVSSINIKRAAYYMIKVTLAIILDRINYRGNRK